MSENYTIKALQRDTKTKSVGKKLRNEGYALASLYGRGKEYSIAVELKEFYKVFSLAGQHSIITLDIENLKLLFLFILKEFPKAFVWAEEL